MAFFRQELAIDLGTANTVIFKDGKVILDEPSIIALETKTDRVNIEFHVAEDPLKAVARGTCLSLKDTDTYPFLER